MASRSDIQKITLSSIQAVQCNHVKSNSSASKLRATNIDKMWQPSNIAPQPFGIGKSYRSLAKFRGQAMKTRKTSSWTQEFGGLSETAAILACSPNLLFLGRKLHPDQQTLQQQQQGWVIRRTSCGKNRYKSASKAGSSDLLSGGIVAIPY